jgi:hypothetical protein
MRQGLKLTFFFVVSVALHGAGMWAAAARVEPGSKEPKAEVAIVDRDLFFRQATRIEARTSRSESVSARLSPQSAEAVRPSQPAASILPAPALAATETEPARHQAAPPPPSAAANLDVAKVAAPPPPRREAVAPESIEAEPMEPVAAARVAAPAPLAAATARLERSPDVAQAERRRASPLASAPAGARLERSAGTGAPPPGRAAEPLARTASDAAARRPLDVVANVEAVPPPAHAPAAGNAEAAPPPPAVESARLAPSSPPAPAGEVARLQTPRDDVAPAAPSPAPDRLAAQDGRPALPGTVPPPLIPPRQAASPESEAAPVLAPAPVEGLRLSATLPGEIVTDRPSVAEAPRQLAPPVAPKIARAPQRAPSLASPAPQPAPAPQSLAALPPAAPTVPVEIARADPEADFTRSYREGECFFPLRVAALDGSAIRGYGVQAESVRLFSEAFAKALGTDPEVEWRPLTNAQCTGISFTRVILGNSAPGIRIELSRKQLAAGERLSGRAIGNRHEFVTLLVVDDSGIVHNVVDYLYSGPAEIVFSVPVYPVDQGMDRVQLVMAVGASLPLPALKSTEAMHSDDYFPALLRQVRETGADMELGLEDFVILGDAS